MDILVPSKKGSFSHFKSVEKVLGRFGYSDLTVVPNFKPETIDIDDNNGDLMHCIENIKVSSPYLQWIWDISG